MANASAMQLDDFITEVAHHTFDLMIFALLKRKPRMRLIDKIKGSRFGRLIIAL